MMKKGIFGFVVCALIAASAFATPTVQLWQQGGYSYSNGGEFTAKTSGVWAWDPLDPLLNLYPGSTKNIGSHDPSFQTFCLEESEYFYQNTTYDVVINDSAVFGGAGVDSYGNPIGDPISQGTAWLYQQFAAGTLGYNYTPGAGRSADAGALQNAIWYLEGEGGSLTGAYTTLLNTQFGSVANAEADNTATGNYNVKVMTLWTQYHAYDLAKDASGKYKYIIQDQLVMSPPTTTIIPAPGAILLAGIGVSLVGWLRRKRSL